MGVRSGPPINVRLVDENDVAHPVDCRYIGIDGKGIRVWEVIVPANGLPFEIRHVLVDVLPQMTSIQMPWEVT